MSFLYLSVLLISAPAALATPLPFWSYDAFPGDAPGFLFGRQSATALNAGGVGLMGLLPLWLTVRRRSR